MSTVGDGGTPDVSGGAGPAPDRARWLLLHGTPLTPSVWDGVRPALDAVRPVVAPLLPPPSSATGAQAEIAARVLADLGPAEGPLHVVGHSFGGQVALEVALAAPDRVASLTVLCSRATPFPAFTATAEALRTGPRPDPDASLGRWFLPDELAADGPLVRYARRCLTDADTEVWADELDAIATYDRTAALADLTVPATIVAAESDHVGTPAEMAAMAAAMTRGRFDLIAPASHLSPFLDPGALAARLLAAAP